MTRVFQFTADVTQMKAYVDTMAAVGGGDGPEAVADALFEVLHMEWRQSAAKVCAFIADAPPHGLGEACDGFPQGTYTVHLIGCRSMCKSALASSHTNQSIDGSLAYVHKTGCPAGHDPLTLARQCAQRGITIYSVGCEPALSAFVAAKDFLIRYGI